VTRNLLLAFNFVLLAGLAIYVFMFSSEKKAYILNQQVFNGFAGKQELEKKLEGLRQGHRKTLDSLRIIIEGQKDDNLIASYQRDAENFAIEERELSEKYTADIWKQINAYVGDYGKSKGYDFIFGTSGDGNIMYANDAHDITKDVVTYINQRYKSGE
jgi:outer membrane protein